MQLPVSEEERIPRRNRLDTEALIIGYAMSRENDRYLAGRKMATWRAAFAEAAAALGLPSATFKNLRDEFDPLHGNVRKGWHGRALRPDRLRVYLDLHDLSDAALFSLVDHILQRDTEATGEAIDALSVTTSNLVVSSTAKRLLTGRAAEDFFIRHSHRLVGVAPDDLLDLRLSACGYDFGARNAQQLAFEVKGLAQTSGTILFTEREWNEAGARREHYRVIVIGNLDALASAGDEVIRERIFSDPHAHLPAQCIFRQSITASWQSPVTV